MNYNEDGLNICKIKVVGVGGAGSNAVNRMVEQDITSATFAAINTDKQALMLSKVDPENRIAIGESLTKGLGAGSDPEVGEQAAEESKEVLEALVDGVDLLFIAAGMGGGTGTGAAPVLAKIAKEKGCITVAVVTKPFVFEGKRRADNAVRGIANLMKYVDTIIIIPNDKLLEALSNEVSMLEALRVADDALKQGICGISDLISKPALINLDFADVRMIIKGQGLAHMGVGRAKGEHRVIEAVRQAVSSPLLETTIEGAKGVILNITGGKDLTLGQAYDAARLVQEVVDPSANIIFGANICDELQEEIEITVIATGFGPKDERKNSQSHQAFINLNKNQTPENNSFEEPQQRPVNNNLGYAEAPQRPIDFKQLQQVRQNEEHEMPKQGDVRHEEPRIEPTYHREEKAQESVNDKPNTHTSSKMSPKFMGIFKRK
ncbi:MAG: cell division protein FtsZ [Clostridia bacterium]|nr:cell division protein FtsZ [Clostridia bacterium]